MFSFKKDITNRHIRGTKSIRVGRGFRESRSLRGGQFAAEASLAQRTKLEHHAAKQLFVGLKTACAAFLFFEAEVLG